MRVSAREADIFDVNTAVNTLFMLFCTFLLLAVVLGISVFYSGLVQRRSSFTALSIPLLLSALFMLDWFIWGYSLCYSNSSNHFIGNLSFSVLRHLRDHEQRVYSTPRGDIVSSVHFLFNGFLKLICIVLTFPACIAERGRIVPMILFVFCWSVLIYNPVTYWFWNEKGWLSLQYNKIPVLDFAGGSCIHIVSGFTSLVYSYILGPRNPKLANNYRNSSTGNVIIGLYLSFVGWCGFIAGCDYKFSEVTIHIVINVFLSGFLAGIIWAAIDYYNSSTPLENAEEESYELRNLDIPDSKEVLEKPQRKISMISFSSGLVCGLVVFTPCGGYISSPTGFWKSIVCGCIGGAIGNVSTGIKYIIHVDDSLDIFAIHGMCGIVGSLLVGIFAGKTGNIRGGWVEGHWIQFAYQLVGIVVTIAYVTVMSFFFLYFIDMIPGLHLRIDRGFNRRARYQLRGQNNSENPENLASDFDQVLERAELMGTDWCELDGEYCMDFMEFIKILDPLDYTEETIIDEPEEGEGRFSQFDTTAFGMRKRGSHVS